MSKVVSIKSEHPRDWTPVHVGIDPFEGQPLVSISDDAFGQPNAYQTVTMTAYQFDELVKQVAILRAEARKSDKRPLRCRQRCLDERRAFPKTGCPIDGCKGAFGPCIIGIKP